MAVGSRIVWASFAKLAPGVGRDQVEPEAVWLELPVDFSGFSSVSQNKINLMLINAENPHKPSVLNV